MQIVRYYGNRLQSIDKVISYIQTHTLAEAKDCELTTDVIKFVETYVHRLVSSLDVKHRCLISALVRGFVYKELGEHSIVIVGGVYKDEKMLGHAWLKLHNPAYNSSLLDGEKDNQKRIIVTTYDI